MLHAHAQTHPPSLPDLMRNADKLAPLPTSCARILRLLDDPEAVLPDVSREVERDHNLATTVLRLASSPLYRGIREVSSISSAVGRIGFNGVREVVVTSAVLRLPGGSLAQAERIRRRMLATAVTARRLAASVDDADPSVTFISGLLLDLGRFVLLVAAPDGYLQTCPTLGAPRVDNVDAENLWLGYSNADVAAHLVKSWRFSERISNTLQMRYAGVDDLAADARVVHAADTLADCLLDGDTDVAAGALDDVNAHLALQAPLQMDTFWPALDEDFASLRG